MPFSRHVSTVALAAALAAGCGDGGTGPNAVTVDDLVGSWTASSALYTNNADSGQKFDIVENGGEVRITVLQGGRARTWVTLGSFSDEWDAQFTVSGNTLISTPVEAARGVRTYSFVLEGNVLTLTNVNSSFDFTLQGGAEVPATQVGVFVRQ